MRVLAHVHKYPPTHNAGAEWMLHAMLRDLVEHGHDVYVSFPEGPAPYRLEGVNVVGPHRGAKLTELARAADVLVTHLDRTREAAQAVAMVDRPLAHVVHNERQLAFHHVKPGPYVLVVSNSLWIDKALGWPGRRIVVRPPVNGADYRTETTRELVTLVNVTEAKGSGLFYRLATAERGRRFLGVLGAYGTQDTRTARRLSNVELLAHTADIVGDVYARTRVVLMPSSYESYGRVAVEAAASGIPTIAHPTEGLVEALGPAGIFVDRGDERGWRKALAELDDPEVYLEASIKALARSERLTALAVVDLDLWRTTLEALAEEHRAAHPDAYASARVGIFDTITAGIRCPVCGAGRCSCKPSASDVAATMTMPVYEERRGRDRGPAAIYRTARGDFRYDEVDASRLGLIPDLDKPAELPRPIRLLISRAAGAANLERATVGYELATMDARRAFLTGLANVRTPKVPEALPALLGALEADLEPLAPPEPGEPAPGTEPPDGRVGDVLEWASTDRDRLKRALELEHEGKHRPTLIAELERRLEVAP